jgi:hypothetical protein
MRHRFPLSATLRYARLAPAGAAVLLYLTLAACDQPVPPRTYAEFMDDKIAREGTIARCDEDQEALARDLECANARRAAAAIALRQERERREALEVESQQKIEALKHEMVERERVATEAALAAARAEREAYEALWRSQGSADVYGPRQLAPEAPADRLSLIELPDHLRRE